MKRIISLFIIACILLSMTNVTYAESVNGIWHGGTGYQENGEMKFDYYGTYTYENGILTFFGEGRIGNFGDGSIGDPGRIFEYGNDVTKIILSEGITAFSYPSGTELPNVKELVIPSTFDAYWIFDMYENVEEFIVSNENETMCSIDGVIYDKGVTELLAYPQKKENERYTAPHSLRTLMLYSDYIKNIELNDEIQYVDIYCENLQDLQIPDSIESLSVNYTNIKSLKYSNGGYYLGNENNPYLCLVGIDPEKSSVNISNKTKVIAQEALSSENIKSIIIPDNVEFINSFSFFCENSLEKIDIGKGLTKLPFRMMSLGEYPKLTEITVSDNLMVCEDQALPNSGDLSSLLEVFDEDSTLYFLGTKTNPYHALIRYMNETDGYAGETLNLPKTTVSLATPCYCGHFPNIKIAYLPKSLKYIADGVFTSSNNLTDVYYDGTLEDWNKIEICDRNEPLLQANIHCKEKQNITGVTLSNEYFTYDGTERSIKVAGTLPDGATVTYTNAKGTNVGTYNAKAVIEADGYNTLTLNATMTITPAPITVTAKDITIKTGAAIPTFDENSYEITSGKLFGGDKITGKLATNCTSTSVAKDFNITQGTLTAGNNYNMSFVAGKLSVVDKTVQKVTVDGVVTEKTYGDEGFKVTVTPDENSKLDNFTMTSSNTNVATIDESGNVTIKNAGTTTISVKEAGNAEYAPFEKTWTLTVNKAKIAVKAKDITIKTGVAVPTFDENSYEITSGKLFGDDKITGVLATNCADTSVPNEFNITKGTLTVSDNYDLTFVDGKLSVVDKTVQNITVADIDAKTYGDDSFKLEVTPDATSQLNTFTYTSSNTDVADVADDGTVTIKNAGETTITVGQAGNEEYAATEKDVKLVVNPIAVTVTAIDMGNKTATIEGVLDDDRDDVELDFDNIKTTVLSSEKSTVDETTTVISTLKVTNFTLNGEKAKNYVTDKTASLQTTVATTTLAEKLTEDENVTIEAAPVDDKTIIVTDIAVAPATEVKKVTIDVTAIADTKVNTVALPKTTVDAIVGIDPEATLEITLKDGSAENKESTIILNAQALAAIQTAGSATTTLSISVDKTEKEELAAEQATKFDEVSTKTPVVYSLNIVDENGNSLASSFGDAGKATVTLPYVKPAGNGNIVVQFLKPDGTVETISNPQYDATTQTVTVELEHFSEYLIYTESVRSSGGGGGVSSYTIKFESNGGSDVKPVSVNKNAVATEPTAPTKEGFKFEGWYTDKELTIAYDFSLKVTKSFTLYAKWSENEKDTEKEPIIDKPETAISFKDIKTTDWFYENVKYVAQNNLMNGVTDDKFAPNDTLTRAMLVTVLYRNAGEPAVNKSIPFADVDMSSWYANAVVWAQQNGIVNGVNDTAFAPDANITREQIAAIMFRYAQYKGMDAVTLEENLHFTDANEISEYAVSAINWAVGTGLINGKSATTLNPKDNATRAEIAAIFQRFIESKN